MANAETLIRRAQELRDARRNHDIQWQRISDYILPSREFLMITTAGARRQPLIYNTEAVLANEQLAGALHGMLTSMALRWFKLHASDKALNEQGAVRAWFEAATDAMFDVFTSPAAGFDLAMYETYLDVTGFGGGVTFIPDGGRRGPRYQAVPLAECYMAQNAEGTIDTLFRLYEMAAGRVVETWPDDVSDRVRKIADKTPDAPVKLVHATYPAPAGHNGDKAWLSCYLEEEGKHILEEGGFHEFPYTCPRWSRRSGETYGTGPALNALPTVRKVNKLEELHLRAVAKAVDPPVVLPDDGFVSPLDNNPGGVTWARSDMPNMDRGGRLGGDAAARPDMSHREIERGEASIKRMFYLEWMTLPIQPNMTATEVLQRRDEMLRLLGPMVARLQTELLGPLIARTFNIMWRNGMFPPAPQELSNAGWHIEYLGPLALAQRAADADSALRWLQSIQLMAQLDPSVVDVVDTEGLARFLADRQGAPARVVRATEVVVQLRDERAKRQAQAEQLAAANSMAATAKDGAGAIAALHGLQGAGQPGAGQPGAGQPGQPAQQAA